MRRIAATKQARIVRRSGVCEDPHPVPSRARSADSIDFEIDTEGSPMAKRMIASGALLAMLTAFAVGQTTHQVDLNGTLFIDHTTGTNVTNCHVGDTIQWLRINGSHTVTNGTSPFLPSAGTLFNANLNSTTTTFSYVVTALGTIPYFCTPHFSFNMLGTINVLPFPQYPGSGEALEMGTAVNTPPSSTNVVSYGGGFDIKQAHQGDALSVVLRSPGGTFNFVPLLMAGQLFPTGGSAPAGALPGLHLNTSGGFIIVNGLDPGASGFLQLLQPGGSTFAFLIPTGVGLPGQSMILQCIASTATANNGFFAIADAHEIQFLP
jgi:plastocyanin